MSHHALSDQQVDNELRKMTEFIKQEAREKAREIEIKSNEEFEIEKSKLVRSETDAIDTLYDKKLKQATLSQQIARSTIANKTRLRVLAARQALLDDIFADAAARLGAGGLPDDRDRHRAVLRGLLLEGFYALDEPALLVRARRGDWELVGEAVGEAEGEFREALGRETKARIDEEHPLPDTIAGGIVILSGSGKIDIDNTFEARLKLLETAAAPAVREEVFGINPNRKFFD